MLLSPDIPIFKGDKTSIQPVMQIQHRPDEHQEAAPQAINIQISKMGSGTLTQTVFIYTFAYTCAHIPTHAFT